MRTLIALALLLSSYASAEEVPYSQVVRTCVPHGNDFAALKDIEIQAEGGRADQALRQVTNVVTLGLGTLVNDTVHEQTVSFSFTTLEGPVQKLNNCLLRDVDLSGSPYNNTVSISDCDFPANYTGARELKCHYPRVEQKTLAAQ